MNIYLKLKNKIKNTDWDKVQTKIDAKTLPFWKHKLIVYFVKVPLFKMVDVVNWMFNIYEKPPIFKTNNDYTSINFVDDINKDIDSRIDPDFLYVYAYKNNKTIDVGDRCIHHGIMLAVESLRVLVDKNQSFDRLNKLLHGTLKLITNDGLLLRGFTNYEKVDNKWVRVAKRLPRYGVSGDQLSGLCFGLAMLHNAIQNHHNTAKFNLGVYNAVAQKMGKLANKFIEDGYKLQHRAKNKIAKFGYFNPSYSIASGACVAPLALLNIAYIMTDNKKFLDEYNKLGKGAGYFKLSQYSELHLLEWNNWFGASVCSLALFSANYKQNNKYLLKGLKRLDSNTRTWGNALYMMLPAFFDKKNKLDKGTIESMLNSYYVRDGEDKFKKYFPWSKKSFRCLALPKRALEDRDYIIQRNAFRDRHPEFPNNDWGIRNGRHDFLLEFYMAHYLGIL